MDLKFAANCQIWSLKGRAANQQSPTSHHIPPRPRASAVLCSETPRQTETCQQKEGPEISNHEGIGSLRLCRMLVATIVWTRRGVRSRRGKSSGQTRPKPQAFGGDRTSLCPSPQPADGGTGPESGGGRVALLPAATSCVFTVSCRKSYGGTYGTSLSHTVVRVHR
jgi:hypothetical protein